MTSDESNDPDDGGSADDGTMSSADAAASDARSSDLGRRISHRRAELHLSMDDVAQRTGMAETYLTYLEHNAAALLSRSSLLRLAAALETSPASLTGGEMDRPQGWGKAGPNPALTPLGREQCRDYLALGGVGRVVFDSDRGPSALPLNFELLDDELIVRTSASTAEQLVHSRIVGFEVDRIDDATSEGWSVLVTGRARVVEDRAELSRIDELGLEPWAGGQRETFVSIESEQVSGRRLQQQPQSGT
ncbi:MAG: pyridoxamine 5'-phosphate oxidase family protein [Acidimicrobiales bacterium]